MANSKIRYEAETRARHVQDEEHKQHFVFDMDSGDEYLNVEYSLKSNARGGFDTWVAVSLFGDTIKIYQNGKRLNGNPPIQNEEVLKCLRTLPAYVQRGIEDLVEETKAETK